VMRSQRSSLRSCPVTRCARISADFEYPSVDESTLGFTLSLPASAGLSTRWPLLRVRKVGRKGFEHAPHRKRTRSVPGRGQRPHHT
jgi:hypothetical protein